MYLYYPGFFYSSLLHSCAPFCGSIKVKLLREVANVEPLSDVKIKRKLLIHGSKVGPIFLFAADSSSFGSRGNFILPLILQG